MGGASERKGTRYQRRDSLSWQRRSQPITLRTRSYQIVARTLPDLVPLRKRVGVVAVVEVKKEEEEGRKKGEGIGFRATNNFERRIQ